MEQDFNKVLPKIESSLDKLKKFPWIVGRNAFLVILLLILLDIIWGGFLSYKYANINEKENFGTNEESLQFHDENYKKVLDNWDKRGVDLQEFLKKDYTNPF
jgi:hypothetical protein